MAQGVTACEKLALQPQALKRDHKKPVIAALALRYLLPLSLRALAPERHKPVRAERGSAAKKQPTALPLPAEN